MREKIISVWLGDVECRLDINAMEYILELQKELLNVKRDKLEIERELRSIKQKEKRNDRKRVLQK